MAAEELGERREGVPGHMDVQASGSAVTAAVPQSSVEAVLGSIAPTDGGTAAPVATPDSSNGVTASAIPPTQTTPAPVPGAPAKDANHDTLAPAIAKLFGSASPPEPIRLDVSYRVLQDPDVIVTVFSNPQTGQEVAQFPPELLIHLSQFFDQPRGVTLDQNA